MTQLMSGSAVGALTLGEAMFLVSFWKPVVLLATLCAWGLIVSNIYDKHAARFFLPREKWNVFHLCMGLFAYLVAVMMPLPGELAFWIGWVVMILILVGDLVTYAVVANKDERVPEAFKINMSIFGKMGEKKEEKKSKDEKNAIKVRLNIKGADGKMVPPPVAETPEAEVRTVSEGVYIKSLESRASQFEIGPSGQQYAAVMTIDGMPVKGDSWEPPAAVRVMDFWKSAAKLDLADRRKKLGGLIDVELGSTKKKVKITSQGVQGGMRLSVLFDPEGAVRRARRTLACCPSRWTSSRSSRRPRRAWCCWRPRLTAGARRCSTACWPCTTPTPTRCRRWSWNPSSRSRAPSTRRSIRTSKAPTSRRSCGRCCGATPTCLAFQTFPTRRRPRTLRWPTSPGRVSTRPFALRTAWKRSADGSRRSATRRWRPSTSRAWWRAGFCGSCA
ncbi:MAG: hypothetical protein QM783_04600 [Phycisphaerales bacterium]